VQCNHTFYLFKTLNKIHSREPNI